MSNRKIPPPTPARTRGGGKKTDKTYKESDFVYKKLSFHAGHLAAWLTRLTQKGNTTGGVKNE